MDQESAQVKNVWKFRLKMILVYGSCIAILAIIVTIAMININNIPKVSYNRVKILEVKGGTKEDVENLFSFKKNIEIFRNDQENGFIIYLNEEDVKEVEDFLAKTNLKHRIVVENLQSLTDEEDEGICQRKSHFKLNDFDTGNHHTYDEISSFLWELPNRNQMVNVEPIGRSVEGRDILLATVSAGNSNKPIIYFDCTIHGREWASTTVCLWILNELSTKYYEDSDERKLLDSYDFYLKPISNPDGYVYSWTMDRLWTKNRARFENSICVGVDLNRNFGTGFSESAKNPCSLNYQGFFPFSEPESKATRDFLQKYQKRIKMVLLMRDFGSSTLATNYEKMEKIMKTGTEAINGTKIIYGSSSSLKIDSSSDTIFSYVSKNLNMQHSYSVKMAENGRYGFMVPVGNIVPLARETWNGIKAALFGHMEK